MAITGTGGNRRDEIHSLNERIKPKPRAAASTILSQISLRSDAPVKLVMKFMPEIPYAHIILAASGYLDLFRGQIGVKSPTVREGLVKKRTGERSAGVQLAERMR